MFDRVSPNRRRQMPAGWIEPCLPTLADRAPTGPGWVHEIKHDGYRLMAHRCAGRVRLLSRNGYDLTARYPLIAQAIDELRTRTCIIDGEAVACDAHGLAVFKLLRSQQAPVHLIAFDLLEHNGADLRDQPLLARKTLLAKLIGKGAPGLAYGEHLDEPGDHVFDHACRLGCEGVVSKRLDSRYRLEPTTGSR
jgi:bifunctional non-homologous end joining protein LigD